MVTRISIVPSYTFSFCCQCLKPRVVKNINMIDKSGIYKRFMECYPDETPYSLAAKFGIHHSLTYQWREGKTPIPWHRLKALVDEQNLSWDWLIVGREPKHRSHSKREEGQPLDRHGINQRFLSLFPGLSNAKLGKELGVRDTTIFKWRHDMEQVPWERLKYAVDAKGVTWEWLIEGR